MSRVVKPADALERLIVAAHVNVPILAARRAVQVNDEFEPVIRRPPYGFAEIGKLPLNERLSIKSGKSGCRPCPEVMRNTIDIQIVWYIISTL